MPSGRCLAARTGTTLDYFAGSGTTGHAVINLNREDGGRRKFILVEMGDHFDTVLMPRLKKVAFSPEWKNGRAVRPATPEEAERGPRIVKYFRLESYEDALNNIEFEEPDEDMFAVEDYMLRYMLRWETKGSATLLNVAALERPFDYKLRLNGNADGEDVPVDLPETFNYLLGLAVRTRRVLRRRRPPLPRLRWAHPRQARNRRHLAQRRGVDAGGPGAGPGLRRDPRHDGGRRRHLDERGHDGEGRPAARRRSSSSGCSRQRAADGQVAANQLPAGSGVRQLLHRSPTCQPSNRHMAALPIDNQRLV